MHRNVKSQPSLRKLFSRWTHFTSKIFSLCSIWIFGAVIPFPLLQPCYPKHTSAIFTCALQHSQHLNSFLKIYLTSATLYTFLKPLLWNQAVSLNVIDVFVSVLLISFRSLKILIFSTKYVSLFKEISVVIPLIRV